METDRNYIVSESLIPYRVYLPLLVGGSKLLYDSHGYRPEMAPPLEGRFKFNFDGGASENPGIIDVGGLINDNEYSIFRSFLCPVVKQFMQWPLEARRLGIQRVKLEGDSNCAIWWAFGYSNAPLQLADVVEEVMDLIWVITETVTRDEMWRNNFTTIRWSTDEYIEIKML